MSRWDANREQRDNERVVCPKCGDEQGNLPLHLPTCDGGTEGTHD